MIEEGRGEKGRVPKVERKRGGLGGGLKESRFSREFLAEMESGKRTSSIIREGDSSGVGGGVFVDVGDGNVVDGMVGVVEGLEFGGVERFLASFTDPLGVYIK